LEEKMPKPVLEEESAAKPPPDAVHEVPKVVNPKAVEPKAGPLAAGVVTGVGVNPPRGDIAPNVVLAGEPKAKEVPFPNKSPLAEPEPEAAGPEPKAEVVNPVPNAVVLVSDVLLVPKPNPEGAGLPNKRERDPGVGLGSSCLGSSTDGSLASSGGADDWIASTGESGRAVVLPDSSAAKQLGSFLFSNVKVDMDPSVEARRSPKARKLLVP
jgi:hypothetical protein